MTRKTGRNIFGQNLAELRKACRLKQEQIAQALDIPPATYSSWERGRTSPDLEWLPKFARYFGVSLERLLCSESNVLRIGSWLPIGQDAKFHPIEYSGGFYTLIYPLIFNRLYFFDPYEKRFYVELIDSWRADTNGGNPSYTFYVRRDVAFHNGSILKLEDVKASYDLLIENDEFFKRFIERTAIISEDHAIRLILRKDKWLDLDALPSPYIIPKVCTNNGGAVFEGTGPFRLADEQRERLTRGLKKPVVLEVNNRYFDNLPLIKVVEFHKFSELAKLETALKGGEINVTVDFAPSGKSDEFDVEYDDFGSLPFYLTFKQDTDENLRKAIDFALDRVRVMKASGLDLNGRALMPNRHLYLLLREDLLPGDGNNYDPEQAKKFLKEASFRGTLKIALFNDDDEVMKRVAQEIIRQLDEVNISAALGPKKNAHALIHVIGFNTYPMVYQILHSSYSSRRWWGYKNTYLDNLLDEFKGMETYQTIQRFLTAEPFFIPLFRQKAPVTHIKNLDTRSKLRKTNAIYGPYLAYWAFKDL